MLEKAFTPFFLTIVNSQLQNPKYILYYSDSYQTSDHNAERRKSRIEERVALVNSATNRTFVRTMISHLQSSSLQAIRRSIQSNLAASDPALIVSAASGRGSAVVSMIRNDTFQIYRSLRTKLKTLNAQSPRELQVVQA